MALQSMGEIILSKLKQNNPAITHDVGFILT